MFFFILAEAFIYPKAMEHYDEDFYGLLLENIFIFFSTFSRFFSKIGWKYLPIEYVWTFYDALNDDFNLINNEAFKAVDDGAMKHISSFPLKFSSIPPMHPYKYLFIV